MRSRVAAVCLAAVAAPAPAGAEPDRRTVELSVDACVEADRDQLDRLFALELAAAIPGARPGRDGAALRLACEGARLRLGWRGGDAAFDRVIDPGPAAGRERTIALAAVELAVAGWLEHRPAPRVAVAEIAEVDDAVAPVAPPARRWRTTASAGGFALGAGALDVAGATLRLARERDRRAGWGWSAEAGAARGREPVALGIIEVEAATAAAGAELGARSGAVRVHAGAGARVTAARFRGLAYPDATGAEVSGIAAGPRVEAGARVCGGALCLDAGVEAGWHVLEVRADVDGEAGRALAGSWWAARLGAGVRW